ncbi:MAG TPA: hypothetical protein VFG76_03140, partial [Candidatus Polarisedimenticolia bacterium]|nr:hypothetical protein [Candidatus Polarisedimenticolia bacterium]
QGSASFFGYQFDTPEREMSSDYRLSSFWSWLGGLGLTMEINDRVSVNFAASYLDQTGIDRVRPIRLPAVPLPSPTGALLEAEVEDDEGVGRPDLISPADMTTLTGTLGFSIKF